MKTHMIAFLMILGLLTTCSGKAQAADEEIHDELRALRKALTDAVTAGDVDKQLEYVHENVVVTWQNNEVVRGRDGLREFLGKMDSGDDKVFQGYKQPPEADELTILYGGETGIAFGSSVPHYKLLGMEFDLENRWTAILVKEGDQWQIASYHVSANVLDNPVLSTAKNATYWTGGLALLLGIGLGMVGSNVMRRLGKK